MSPDGSISTYRNRNSDVAFFAGVALLVLIFDQLTKHAVLTGFMPGESRIVIPHVLKWTYAQNQNGAFGLFGNSPVLLIAMAIVVLGIFWFSFRDAARQSLVVRIAFGLILGGAIGNIIDRVHLQYVVDFIDFYRIWPNVFNVADACISSGVALLILSSLATRRHA